MTCPRRVTSKDVGKLVCVGLTNDPQYNTVVGVTMVDGMYFYDRYVSRWSHQAFVAVSEAFHVPDPPEHAGGQTIADLASPV
jgi:hypothetical protein